MNLYRLTVKLLSSIVTPLKGDTIWGHLVWGIANNEGDDAVSNFLQKEKESPQLVVSSAFPHGLLCKPYPKPKERTKQLDITKYSEIKKNKKIKYVDADEYLDLGDSYVNLDVYKNDTYKNYDDNKNEKYTNCFTSESRMHNNIDRYSGTVIEDNLFDVVELWAKTNLFDIYVCSSFTEERLAELFKWGFANGFGADASVGKGNIEIVSEPKIVKPKKSGTCYMALAPFVLPKNDVKIENLRADIFLRTGKVGGAFASYMNPYKKTVLLYDEGAVFTSEKNLTFVGELLTDIHSDDRICQAGFAPVIPHGE